MRTTRPLRALSALALAGLGGCSVSTPVRLSTPLAASLPASVSVNPGADPAPAMAAFATAFSDALAVRNTRVAQGQPFVLTLALSAQDSASGVTQDAGHDVKAITWRSSPRRRSIFDGCRPQRLRAVVIGAEGLTARPSLHAEAELDTCKGHDSELRRLAASLADNLTRR